MITMIYAAAAMTVDIRASEDVSLQRVDIDGTPRTLHPGGPTVSLERGVFMVLSKSPVGVTVGQAHIISRTNKDGPPGDPPKPFAMMLSADRLLDVLAKDEEPPS